MRIICFLKNYLRALINKIVYLYNLKYMSLIQLLLLLLLIVLNNDLVYS